MLNKVNIRRRKWAFEKGRNSRGALLAAAVTAAVVIVQLVTLRYGFTPHNDRRQTTELSLISKRDINTLQLIRELDPAETYRINSGGYPFCMNCRRSHENFCTADDVKDLIARVENTSAGSRDIRNRDDHARIRMPEKTAAKFPVATGFAAILPADDRQYVP